MEHHDKLNITILLVEDNPTDVMLTEEAFANAKLLNKMYVTKDGIDALNFLYKRDPYHWAPRPDIILLDLNMPRKNGQEVLAELKNDDNLKTIPAVILTTSKDDRDKMKAYGNHANCYINKPVNFDDFMHVVQSIQSFWFTIVSLPER